MFIDKRGRVILTGSGRVDPVGDLRVDPDVSVAGGDLYDGLIGCNGVWNSRLVE